MLDFIHLRIHCKILLSGWGPLEPCLPRPFWAAVTLRAHTLSQVSSSTPVCGPKTKHALGGECVPFVAIELWNYLPRHALQPTTLSVFQSYLKTHPFTRPEHTMFRFAQVFIRGGLSQDEAVFVKCCWFWRLVSATSSSQWFQLQSNSHFVFCNATKMRRALSVLYQIVHHKVHIFVLIF